MKNSQLAVLSFVILLAAVIVAGSNWLLIGSITGNRPTALSGPVGTTPAPGDKLTIAMMPKSKGNAYFIACCKAAIQTCVAGKGFARKKSD